MLQGFFAIECPATTNEAPRGLYCSGMRIRAFDRTSLIEHVTRTSQLVRAGPWIAGETPPRLLFGVSLAIQYSGIVVPVATVSPGVLRSAALAARI